MSKHEDVFEAVIPWQCIPDVLAIVKTRDYSRQNTGDLMQHAGWFLGCTGKMIGGVPTPDPAPPEPVPEDDWLFGGSMGAAPMSMAERISNASEDQLESKLEECYSNAGFSGPTAAVNWQAIWAIAGPILLELLKRWLEKANIK